MAAVPMAVLMSPIAEQADMYMADGLLDVSKNNAIVKSRLITAKDANRKVIFSLQLEAKIGCTSQLHLREEIETFCLVSWSHVSNLTCPSDTCRHTNIHRRLALYRTPARNHLGRISIGQEIQAGLNWSVD